MYATHAEQNTFETLAFDDEWCCCTWQDAFVLVWWGAATAQRASLAAASMRAFAAARPRGCVLFTVITPTATPPDSSVRPIFSKAMRDAADHIRGAAYYVPIAGFKGAAVRSVITGLALLAGERFPTTAHGELPHAAAWAMGRLASGWNASWRAEQLSQVVEQLLDRHRYR